jgi:ribose transport system substrate-binding protein
MSIIQPCPRAPRPRHRTWRILAAATALSCLAVAGCAQSAAAGGQKHIKIIYIDTGPKDVLTSQTRECAGTREARALGVSIQTEISTDFSLEAEEPLVAAAILEHPSAIVMADASQAGLTPDVRRAQAAGIKVVAAPQDLAQANAEVSYNNDQGGREAADRMGQLLAGRTGQVAMIGYEPGGSPITDAIQQSFASEIKKFPNLDYIGMTAPAYDPTAAATATLALLDAHPHLIGLFVSDNEYVLGVGPALQEAHAAGKVLAIGMEASGPEVTFVRDGTFHDLFFASNSILGKTAVQLAVELAQGKHVPKTALIPMHDLDKANVDTPQMQALYASATNANC